MNYTPEDVSVVITTTGSRVSELHSALESVTSQTVAVNHVFVVWDLERSSFGMREFISTHPNVKHLLTGIDYGGVSNARNFGIQNCDTRLIAILDDDDIWYPHKIAKQLAALNKYYSEKVLCLSQSLLISENYRVLSRTGKKEHGIDILEIDRLYSNLPLRSTKIYLPTSSMIFSKSLFSEIHFNEDLKSFEDIQFMLEASNLGPCLVVNEPLVLTLIRKNKKTGLSHEGFDFEQWSNWVQKSDFLTSRNKGNILIYFGTKRLLQANEFKKAFSWIISNSKIKPDFHTLAVTILTYFIGYFKAAVLSNRFRRT
jgi:glycosyltransferase involved in cell wall biosynthesis